MGQIEAGEIFKQEIRPGRDEFFNRRDSRPHRDRLHSRIARRLYVRRGIADQGNSRIRTDQALAAGTLDGHFGQVPAGWRHFSESAETEVVADSRAQELVPADPREVSRDEREHDPALREFFEDGRQPRTQFVAQIGNARLVEILRRVHRGGEHALRLGIGDSGRAEHQCQDDAIQHAMDRDPVRSGGDSRHLKHGVFKRRPVMRPRAPRQSAVDIEEYK